MKNNSNNKSDSTKKTLSKKLKKITTKSNGIHRKKSVKKTGNKKSSKGETILLVCTSVFMIIITIIMKLLHAIGMGFTELGEQIADDFTDLFDGIRTFKSVILLPFKFYLLIFKWSFLFVIMLFRIPVLFFQYI